MTVTDDWIEEQIALCDAATKGPWRYDGMHNEIHSDGDYFLIVSECRSAPDQQYRQDEFRHQYDANFALIAAMREGYPAVLEELQGLRASFVLYARAVQMGQRLYLEAHPELGELVEEDKGKVVAWLVQQVEQRPWAECPRCGAMCLEQDMVNGLCPQCAAAQ